VDKSRIGIKGVFKSKGERKIKVVHPFGTGKALEQGKMNCTEYPQALRAR